VLQELKQHAARALWFLARYAGESNTPLAYLCSAGESNTPRGDFGFARATRIKATRRAGTLVSRALRRRKQHAAGVLVRRRRKQHAAQGLRFLARYAGESNTPRGNFGFSSAPGMKATRR